MAINTKKYIESYLHIRTKTGEDKRLKLNEPQQKLYDAIATQANANKPIRIIVLKARQMGFSTLTEAVIFKKIATTKNISAAVVAHVEESTTNLFNMSKYYYESIDPPQLKPSIQASNAKEIHFGKLNSRLRCYTAGGDGIGRSATIQMLHISELAFWKCDKANVLLGLLQAVPFAKESMIIIESTANGYEYYKELWDKAVAKESDYLPIFVGWNELEEYQMQYNGQLLTVEEEVLKKGYSLSNEQLMWRRWCIANNCGGDINLFRQEYPICPEEAFIATGTCVFDKESILARLGEVKEAKETGLFTYNLDANTISNIKWLDGEYVKIYKPPEHGSPYVIACDTAGEGSDYNVAQVIDNITGEQVATIHGRLAEDIFAEQVYCLGKHYNDALIGIEVNFSTYPTRRLEQLGYTNMYIREVEDTITHQIKKSYGFKTTSLTRPIILSELIRLLRDNINLINDKATLRELLTFIRNDKGRMEAQQGSHDDLVMALAIVYYIRSQQRSYVIEPKVDKAKWDMFTRQEDKGSYVDNLFN